MQRREYAKAHRLDQLGEELGALPELAPTVDSDGERNAVFLVEGRERDHFIRVSFPDGIDPSVIDAVVNAHVPSSRTDSDIRNERERFITNRMRKLAIDALKSEGKLPPEFPD